MSEWWNLSRWQFLLHAQCVSGFNGNNCENNIDDCIAVTCQNGGTCQDGINSYTCQCTTGYEGDNCENNIDDCIGVTCENGGNCIDGLNVYTCDCADGYSGEHCENVGKTVDLSLISKTQLNCLYAKLSPPHSKFFFILFGCISLEFDCI